MMEQQWAIRWWKSSLDLFFFLHIKEIMEKTKSSLLSQPCPSAALWFQAAIRKGPQQQTEKKRGLRLVWLFERNRALCHSSQTRQVLSLCVFLFLFCFSLQDRQVIITSWTLWMQIGKRVPERRSSKGQPWRIIRAVKFKKRKKRKKKKKKKENLKIKSNVAELQKLCRKYKTQFARYGNVICISKFSHLYARWQVYI